MNPKEMRQAIQNFQAKRAEFEATVDSIDMENRTPGIACYVDEDAEREYSSIRCGEAKRTYRERVRATAQKLHITIED